MALLSARSPSTRRAIFTIRTLVHRAGYQLDPVEVVHLMAGALIALFSPNNQ